MGKLLQNIVLGASLALASCETPRAVYDYADLNGDGYKEVIKREYDEGRFVLTAEFSRKLHNGVAYSEPRIIFTSEIPPQEYTFVDFDKDGDIDLTLAKYVEGVLKSFISENNGKGIFSELRPLN